MLYSKYRISIIQVNQYPKIFHACLLVEGDKLITVNIIYLEDDVTIKDERLQNSIFWHLKLAY